MMQEGGCTHELTKTITAGSGSSQTDSKHEGKELSQSPTTSQEAAQKGELLRKKKTVFFNGVTLDISTRTGLYSGVVGQHKSNSFLKKIVYFFCKK